MNEYAIALLLFGSAFVLLMSGIPIWAGLAGISIIFILIFSPHTLPTIPYVLYGSMDSFALLAIPLFILLSAPIAESDASKDLYETLHKWLYKIPGGLGIANMIGCGIFAALCRHQIAPLDRTGKKRRNLHHRKNLFRRTGTGHGDGRNRM